jgi:hypothetical protein
MKKVPFGFIYKPSWTNESTTSISTTSRKCYFSGKRQLQKMPPRIRPPFYNNFLISSLKEKVFLQGGWHVRDLTFLTPHVGRIIYFPYNKGQH